MSRPPTPPPGLLDEHTRKVTPSSQGSARADERVAALTVIGHPIAAHVGDRATLFGLYAGEVIALSRVAPGFARAEGGPPRPLSDPFLSRNPIATIERRAGVIHVARAGEAVVRIDGEEIREPRAIDDEELARGAVIELADRCVLLLHLTDATPSRRPPRFDLVGESDAIRRLQRDIARVAATDMRVLVRGETGAGKELAARAIHTASKRAGGPLIAVNMSAVPPSLAASALFGHARGAFSGAVADHEGYFAEASGGTLFLDEIGDTDMGVQAMLLRTLETSEVQRVGDRRARKVDVRLISATDADLEAAVADGRFREPLLHRVSELSVHVPPLRDRRDDIGLLVVRFLRELLDPSEQERLLDGPVGERPWLAPRVIARLARAPWTGNVRQLRNVVRQLVVLGRDERELTVGPEIEATIDVGRDSAFAGRSIGDKAAPKKAAASPPSDPPPGPKAGKGRSPKDLTEAEILDALEKTGFRRAAAADLLGIARSSLYAIIAANKGITKVQDLARGPIEEAVKRHGGDLARAAAELHVSEHGLKIRMRALGISL